MVLCKHIDVTSCKKLHNLTPLNWSNQTAKTFLMLQYICISSKCWTLKKSIAAVFSIDKNKCCWAGNPHITMISERLCDTEDWKNQLCIAGINSILNLYYCFFYQMYAFFKNIKSYWHQTLNGSVLLWGTIFLVIINIMPLMTCFKLIIPLSNRLENVHPTKTICIWFSMIKVMSLFIFTSW